VTTEKQSRHSPELILESVARVTKNGFVAYDAEDKITYFSEKMSEITGWIGVEIIGKNISELYVVKDSCNFKTRKEVCSQAVVLFTRDGKQIPLETRITPITTDDGSPDGFLVFFVIEDYKKDLDRAQSEFISTVSHELRTPITSIKGFASTLLQQSSVIDDEKRKKYTKIIKDQAERLSRLVEDLLAVSRLESKKLQLTIHPVKLKPLIEDIAVIVESKFKNTHRVEISCDEKIPQVWVDSDRLIQILTNLIDNAVKYSPGKDLVEVKVRTCQHNGKEMVRVNISDYGIGIKEEDQRKVFTKFSRLDSPLTRKTEGTGLGLYISHSLAHLIGGDLSLKSEAGKTTFSLYLPVESHKGGEIWWD
jgi:two-component system, OmpR family, phosphate regulon sensor histidine kinase PhoR